MELSLKGLAEKAGLWEGVPRPGDCDQCGVGGGHHDPQCPKAPPLRAPAAVAAAVPPLVDPSITNPAYDTLVARTRFEDTDAGKIYRKYYDRLGRILDEHLRRATAIDFATNDGVDGVKLAAAFDELDTQLKAEADKFNAGCDAHMRDDYQKPKNRVDEITAQIDRLQQEKAGILATLQPALDKVTTVKAQFQSAWERRSAELKQQRSLFTGG